MESRFLLMLTITSEATLQQRFGSSANCGLRRDCLRYPNHEGFNGKLRCHFLMSWLDVPDLSDAPPPQTNHEVAFQLHRRVHRLNVEYF